MTSSSFRHLVAFYSHSDPTSPSSLSLCRPLFAYLNKMVGNAADAEDLLQETLVRVARGPAQFEQRSSVKTWVYKVATNVAIDSFRQNKKGQYIEFDEGDDRSDFDTRHSMILDQMNQCIRRVVDSLPPDYRAALILTSFEANPWLRQQIFVVSLYQPSK